MGYTHRIANKNLGLIGISGKLSSGKDLVCQIIQWCDNKDLKSSFPEVKDYLDFCNKFGIPGLKLNEQHDNSLYLNCKFATKIKEVVSVLTGISLENLERQDIKSSYLPSCWDIGGVPITVREFMQKVGTDALKNIVHPEIWINALYSSLNPSKKYIISDVRFLDEASSVLQRNGLLIRVERNLIIDHKYKNHISETQLDKYSNWDIIINNDGSIDDLIYQVKNKVFLL